MKKSLLCDFHVHTTFSDGNLSLQEVIDFYGKKGFDVIAITDHLFDNKSSHSLEMIAKGAFIQDFDEYWFPYSRYRNKKSYRS